MLENAHVIAFVGTTNPARAQTFYEDTLGLKLVADDPFALVFISGGTMLRVSKVQSLSPLPFTVLGWSVPDISAAVRSLRERGVEPLRFEEFSHDENGVFRFPDGTGVAWFKDPDGNMLSFTEIASQSRAP